MNILTSYNWIKEYLKNTKDVQEFARLMTNAGNSVEYIINVGEKFQNMVVGKIVAIKNHPNANKLKIVETDIGSKKVNIVCGGSNLEEDRLVVVGLPGAKVRWHGKGDLVELKETEIRGEKSFGMICAAEEIGLDKLQGKEAEILDITDITNAKPGTTLGKALDLNETLFDIEVTTNRPDAMSIVGLAREAGVVGAGEFSWKPVTVTPGSSDRAAIEVEVKEPKLCPRYQAIVIDGVKVGPSPWWMRQRLLLSGHRPINNIVDVTNYVLHELGQPLHAFDADKLAGEKIIVRKANKGEKMTALDGNEYELETSQLVIADSKNPVAIAGVMGGMPTGTTEETTRIVIECAIFDPVSVRKTSRALNLYSDSSHMFEKGLSTESTPAALARAVELIQELAGGKVVSDVIDEQASKYKLLEFPYDPQKVNARIGVEVSDKEQKEILTKLGFEVKKGKVVVPYWRDNDIEASVDLSEEIARVYGYENIPAELPEGTIPNTQKDTVLLWERRVKQIMRGAGCGEMYSFAFASEDELTKWNIPLDRAVKLLNPLSEEWAYMRPTLLTTMVRAIEFNQHRFEHGELFELAAVHHPVKGDIPEMHHKLLIAVYDQDGVSAILGAKGIMERLFRQAGVSDWRVEQGSSDDHYHPGRVAQIHAKDGAGEVLIGTIGELAPMYAKVFGVDVRVALVDIDFEALLPLLGEPMKYETLPEFPAVERDISFVIDERIHYDAVLESLKESHHLVDRVQFVDVYQGKGVEDGKKSMTFRLELRAEDKTLSSDEADSVMKEVVNMLKQRFSAIIR